MYYRPPQAIWDRCPQCGSPDITFINEIRKGGRFAQCEGSKSCGWTGDYADARKRGDAHRAESAPGVQRYLTRRRRQLGQVVDLRRVDQ